MIAPIKQHHVVVIHVGRPEASQRRATDLGEMTLQERHEVFLALTAHVAGVQDPDRLSRLLCKGNGAGQART